MTGKRIEKDPTGRAMRRMDAQVRDIMDGIVEDEPIPSRARLYWAVRKTLQADPYVFSARILALAQMANSKITIAPAEAVRLGIMLGRAFHAPPEHGTPIGENDEYQLEFAWAQPEKVIEGETE